MKLSDFNSDQALQTVPATPPNAGSRNKATLPSQPASIAQSAGVTDSRRNPRTIIKMSDMYNKHVANRGSGPGTGRVNASGGNSMAASNNPVEKQRFSRVLSQVKLLETNGTTNNLIKTLRKQAKTLKMSRKKILQSSCSMSDYQTSCLEL